MDVWLILSNIATILAIIGFGITMWQLCFFRKELKHATVKGQQQVENIARLSTISSAIQLAEDILWQLQLENYGVASCKIQELNNSVIEICESDNYESIEVLSHKRSYLPIVIKNTLGIDKNLANSELVHVSFLQEKVQDVHDELKSVETKFKKKILKV